MSCTAAQYFIQADYYTDCLLIGVHILFPVLIEFSYVFIVDLLLNYYPVFARFAEPD
jgi:hypothetical protein